MRNSNMLTILKCIKEYGPLTKRDIQNKTGLSWGAISNITNDLLKKRIIYEFKLSESLVGRTPSQLEINDKENLIIGIDINIEGLTAVLTDLKSRILKNIKVRIKNDSKEEIITQAKQLIYSIMQESGVQRYNILGIGVAMQGAVDIEKGISIFSPHFTDWTNVPVKGILEKEFGLPVYVEHDPNCMAMSEKWLGYAKDSKNFLFIRLSMGIGMSIIINGDIYRGADGSAGEFGHITMNPNGSRCYCGNYGCLESYASGRSILQKAEEGLKLGRTNVLKTLAGAVDEIDLATVATALRQGDDYLAGVFDDVGTYLGIGISNLINIFNPDLIVIGGELSKYSDLFMDRVRQLVNQKSWKGSRINIITSKFNDDSAALGASALIIQKFFNGDIISIAC